MSEPKPNYKIQGFVWCESCKEFEDIKNCTADTMGYCVCCACNPPLKTGVIQDNEGRAIR